MSIRTAGGSAATTALPFWTGVARGGGAVAAFVGATVARAALVAATSTAARAAAPATIVPVIVMAWRASCAATVGTASHEATAGVHEWCHGRKEKKYLGVHDL